MTRKHSKQSKNRGYQVNSPKIKIGDVTMSKLKKDLVEQRKLYTISSKSPDEKVRLRRSIKAVEQELLKRNAHQQPNRITRATGHHIAKLIGPHKATAIDGAAPLRTDRGANEDFAGAVPDPQHKKVKENSAAQHVPPGLHATGVDRKNPLIVGIKPAIENVLQKKGCGIRKARPKKSEVEACMTAEKTKPWIKNYIGTLIQLSEDKVHNKFFRTLTESESKNYPGWYVPNDRFYSIFCKGHENYLPSQKNAYLTIAITDNSLGEAGGDIRVGGTVKLKIAYIMAIASTTGQPERQTKLFMQTQENISARNNYWQNILPTDDGAVEDLLLGRYSMQGRNTIDAVRYKLTKYTEHFAHKLSKEKIKQLLKLIFAEFKPSDPSSVASVLTRLVKATLFLRNDFDMINGNFIAKINNNIISMPDLLDMAPTDMLPELYDNPQLDIQVEREHLQELIKTLSTKTVNNLATNILLYKMNLDRADFATGDDNLKWNAKDHDTELELLDQVFDFEDIVPLHNLCASKFAEAHGKQITPDDLDELGGLVFYKDSDGQLYSFTLLEIKNILISGSTINPLSGNEFSPEFLQKAGKFNLQHVGVVLAGAPVNFVKPFAPSSIETRVPYNSSDESSNESDESEASDESDSEASDDEGLDDVVPDHSRCPSCRDKDFLNWLDEFFKMSKQRGPGFNFESMIVEVSDAVKPHYCFSCSKHLSDPSTWSTTVNMVKQSVSGSAPVFEKNTYHIKCLRDAHFRI